MAGSCFQAAERHSPNEKGRQSRLEGCCKEKRCSCSWHGWGASFEPKGQKPSWPALLKQVFWAVYFLGR